MTTPGDDARGVRAVDMYVQARADQLAELVGLVDAGELTVDIARRVPLSELPAIHAEAEAGRVHGKVVVVPSAR
jgi:NADPH:quinone reductase-like Zn-dependent oxidoreductase